MGCSSCEGYYTNTRFYLINYFSLKVQTGGSERAVKSSGWTHLQALGHQDLSGLLDHRLWLELLFTEGVPPGVVVRLVRHIHVRRIHVVHAVPVWTAVRRCQQRWTGGRGGRRGGLTGVVHTGLTPCNQREA